MDLHVIFGLLVSGILASSAPRSQPATTLPFGYRDVLVFKSVSGLLSPHGRTVLAVVQHADPDRNETVSSSWRTPFEGGKPVRLTQDSSQDKMFRWSPDGSLITFLGERDGERGLFAIRPDGGEPQKILRHDEGLLQYQWSPDGRRIAFISPDPLSDEEELAVKEKRDVTVEEGDRRMSHVWIFEPSEGRRWKLTSGDAFTVQSIAWSPDSKSIAFSATLSPNASDFVKSDIYRVAVEAPSGSAETGSPASALPVKLTTNAGEDIAPQFTPDGRSIVYRTRPPGDLVGSTSIVRIPAEGGGQENISPLADISVGSYEFDLDGRTAYFAGIKGVEADVFRMNLQDRIPIPITPGNGVWGGPSFSADRKRFVCTFKDPLHPEELVASETSSFRPRPLTDINGGAAGLTLAKTERIGWRSFDGRPIEGLLVYPADYDEAKRYPLIVDNHGGPAGLYLLDFSPEAQFFAGQGYFVFRPNFRGSAGYGEEFRRADVGDWGGGDYRDVMTGLQALLKRKDVDREKLGVMGWSFGGFMTAWMITQTPLFKAAVVGAGMVDHLSMWGTQDSPLHYAAYLGGDPFQRGLISLYRRRSPLAHIQNVRTPVLILHGREDKRVPASQALLFYNALKAKGVEAELIWYPRTGHAPQEPRLRLDLIQRQAAWFSRHLTGR